ncbi:MAG: hypothetical protein ACK4PR_09165, partial [Gammaproteobacteria bacterium]
MWEWFKRYIVLYFFLSVSLLSALCATISSTINPAIPVIKAGIDIANYVNLDKLPTIPLVAIAGVASTFFVILPSFITIWKKILANGSKALEMYKLAKSKLITEEEKDSVVTKNIRTIKRFDTPGTLTELVISDSPPIDDEREITVADILALLTNNPNEHDKLVNTPRE